jgi:hypothetical protein
MIADCAPATPSDENTASKLLGSFLFLGPDTSLLFDFSIDKNLFGSLQHASLPRRTLINASS